MNYFAANLAFCRKAFDVSQTQLSSVIGRGQSTIAGWENGVSEPNVEALMKISGFFAISVDDLIKVDFSELDQRAFKGLVKDDTKLKGLEDWMANKNARNRRQKPPIPYPFDNVVTTVDESDPMLSRSTMKILKVINGKIDELLSLTKRQGSKTAKK